MQLNELLPELLKLDPDEMVQVIEILKHELNTTAKVVLVDKLEYQVGSPQITPETAGILQEMLREAKEKHG